MLLDRLHLPSDVLDLMLSRLESVERSTRRLLSVAAVQGMQFDAGILTHITGEEISGAIAGATHHRIIEHVAGDMYTFVHERLRAAVLANLDEATREHLHARTAEALEHDDGDRVSDAVYAIARHRIAAGAWSPPDETYHACVAAGQRALDHYATFEAVTFLAAAADVAAAAGMDLDVGLREMYATALLRTGNSASAQEQVTAALDREHDPLRRAELWELLVLVQLNASDYEQGFVSVMRGLAEIGAALPRRKLPLIVSTVVALVAGLAIRMSPRRFGTATGVQRRRYVTELKLLHAGFRVAGVTAKNALFGVFLLRSLVPANRIGPSRQRTTLINAFGFLLTLAGARRLGARVFASAERAAALSADPAQVAEAAIGRGVAPMFTVERTDVLAGALEQHGRWTKLSDAVPATAQMVALLASAGDTQSADLWVRRARGWLRLGGAPQDAFLVECVASSVEAMRGHAAEAHETLRAARDSLPVAPNMHQLLCVSWATLVNLLEQGEIGGAFDEAVAELEDAGISADHMRAFPIRYPMAYGRLAQAHAARQHQTVDSDELEHRLAQARAGIRALRHDRGVPRLRAGRLALRAWLLHLIGRDRAALRMLYRARRVADGVGAALLMFDIEHVHARTLRSLGHDDEAQQHATFALSLAVKHGWESRARRIRDEFGHPDVSERSGHSLRGSTGVSSSDQADGRQRRRLEALQQVTATAASVLDPNELIRVALDVTLRLLAAERVFIFLVRQDSERPDGTVLVPHRGCDVDDNDLRELTNYSSTLVEQVWRAGEALVVTGSEQGAALGSQSAMVHGLRSILVAPLQLKGRTLGVIYLDSRVARGVFTSDDVELLVAITHQVAAALETARAATLEAEVKAAHRQRDLAETLRTSMTDLNSTLDPGEVLQRLLVSMATTLRADRAVLLRNEPDAADDLLLWTESAAAPEERPGVDIAVDTLGAGDAPAASSAGSRGPALPAELSALLGGPRSWLAVPIVSRRELAGAIVLGSPVVDGYTDVDVEVAAALAEQGAVAYENARLFSRVRELATTDALTGLATRRHFWELAEHQLAAATRYGRPQAAIMLDIDHFKAVNDMYGHSVGDTVLHEVAARLRAQTRTSDIIGRVGGEEFALLLEEASDASVIAERMRATVAQAAIQTDRGPVDASISLGVSYLRPGDDLAGLLSRADAALYRSKADGRNRVTVA